VADGGEDDVGGVAGAAFEIAAAEVTFGLQVADDGLDGGAAQLAPDDTEDAALLARDEDDPAEPGAQGAQLPPVPLELFGMGIAGAVDPVPIDLAGQ